jgi:hypothetical protein
MLSASRSLRVTCGPQPGEEICLRGILPLGDRVNFRLEAQTKNGCLRIAFCLTPVVYALEQEMIPRHYRAYASYLGRIQHLYAPSVATFLGDLLDDGPMKSLHEIVDTYVPRVLDPIWQITYSALDHATHVLHERDQRGDPSYLKRLTRAFQPFDLQNS